MSNCGASHNAFDDSHVKILAEKNENIQHTAVNLIPNKPPTILSPLRDVTSFEGEIIELEARITGVPK